MHMLEQYALATGVKIKKPYIYEKFFPISVDKFISFHPASKPSKTYDHWQEVINFLQPYLEKENIKIIQLGQEKEKVYNGVINFVGFTNINQIAFILRHSMLHFGADSFPTHIASSYDKKIVALYSNNYINCVKPVFGDEKNHILLEPKRNTKPSFSFQENPKSINSIKPELIAKHILKLLEIPEQINFETIYFGDDFNNGKLEMVPNQVVDPRQFNCSNIIVRMDLEHNENILNAQLKVCSCFIITDKTIDSTILLQNKAHVGKILFEVKDSNGIEFIKFLTNQNIPYQLFTYLKGEDLKKIKLDYIDQEFIVEMPTDLKSKTNLQYTSNIFYKSNKRLISNNKIYLSESSLKNNIEAKSLIEPIIDCPEFWKELENFWVFKIDKTATA